MGAAEARVRGGTHGPIWDVDLFTEARLPSLATAFSAARPFPHLVLDGLFDRDLLSTIASEFGIVGADIWETYDNPHERKQGSRVGRALPPATQVYFDCIHSGPFLRCISALTGVDNLIVDPTVFGGGMHQMREGGFFAPHLDFQQHPSTHLDNRVVLITFLNPDWREQNGGMLELWGDDKERCDVSVLPTFGRTVLFLQTPKSVHGVTRVCAPPGSARRSLGAYYYSNGVPERQRLLSTTTIFMRRTGRRLGDDAKWWLKRLAPPILVEAARSLRHRGRRGGRQ